MKTIEEINQDSHIRAFYTRANAIARANGYGMATKITRDSGPSRVVSHVPYGYRKNTTGEYVPNAYRCNFGWKNTYYQNALTEVNVHG